MNNNIAIDSLEQVISTITDTVSYKIPVSLVDTLTSDYTPFSSHYVEPERVVSSVVDLFGAAATIHTENNVEPLLSSTLEFNYFPIVQYALVLATLIFASLVVCKFSDHVRRLFKLTFSFPHLRRQLESANNAIDTMAHYASAIILFMFPLTYLSASRYYSSNLGERNTLFQIFVVVVFVVGIYLYNVILKYLFYRFSRNRYFYRRLFIAERICISSYIFILLPLLLLASVANPYQYTLIKVQFLMVLLFSIHYLGIVFKLFIEEKVSYIQLILYFCTVKAVVISLIIYFGILWL